METLINSVLRQEFAERQLRNQAYSLRAFARDLGAGSTTLSDVLAGKRNLSKRNLRKIMDKLLLSPALQETILQEHAGKKISKAEQRLSLDEDTFQLIADWHYVAILNLAKIKNSQASAVWVSKRLGIEKADAEIALERLYRLGLLKKTKGKLVRTAMPLTTSSDIPSAAIKRHHLQILRLAEQSLLNDPVHMREISLVTMPINIEKLAKAKEILLNTRKKIAALLEDGQASEVYTLAFQLFPVTKPSTIKGDDHE